jgi:hypothetical protein
MSWLCCPLLAEPSRGCAADGFERGHIKGARSPGVGRKPHALTFEYQHRQPLTHSWWLPVTLVVADSHTLL